MTTSLRRLAVAAALATSVIAIGAGTVSADAHLTEIVYSGQGIDDAGDLESVVCGTENGAEAGGAYVLFILTANSGTDAFFDAGDDSGPMMQSGNGAWKFIYTGSTPLEDLVGVATATFGGTVRGNPQLVISHGCPGEPQS